MTNLKKDSSASRSANWNQLYRPRRVQDLHLANVRSALQNLMASPHFPQVLLFAGPKGTGKTSVARIIGAMLNDPINANAVEQRFFSTTDERSQPLVEPDGSSALADGIFGGQSYVVQELDAASNRGIDDVRALKERSALPPSQGRISVFILDEVHMLTIEAFNALLKLLEEPPAHALFVLATTELHKLPETIISRCHLIRFHKASVVELTAPLRAIIADQKLTVAESTIELLARLADGSFRDAVKLMQQFVYQGGSTEQLAALTETLSDTTVASLIEAVIQKNPMVVAKELEALRHQGADEQHFLQFMVQFLHQDLLRSLQVQSGENRFDERVTRFFLQQLTNPDLLKPAPIPFLRLELALLELIDRARSKSNSTSQGPKQHATAVIRPANKPALEPKKEVMTAVQSPDYVVLIEPDNFAQVVDELQAPILETALDATATSTATTESLSDAPLGDGKIVCEKWQELVTKASDYNFGLATLLRSAQPIEGGHGEVVLRVYYSFHKEQLLQNKWRQFWNALTTEIAGGIVNLDCVVEQLAQGDALKTALQPGVTLQTLAVDALM